MVVFFNRLLLPLLTIISSTKNIFIKKPGIPEKTKALDIESGATDWFILSAIYNPEVNIKDTKCSSFIFIKFVVNYN
jgi:hypothetical protein